jgi:hypothetical protein
LAVTVLPVIRGSTVILKSELSEQAPEVTVLRYHVVVVRLPGWNVWDVALRLVKVTLSGDDAHAYVKVPRPPAGVPDNSAGAVPVPMVS